MEDKTKNALGLAAALGIAGLAVYGLSKASRKKVFVSFDYENDKHYKFLLDAWSNHEKFEFVYDDHSADEVHSNSVKVVKERLASEIRNADYTLVLVGKYANAHHKDWMAIGFRNWINFEISESKAAGNKLIAVKLDRTNESPEQLLGAKANWAMAFSHDAILRALNEA